MSKPQPIIAASILAADFADLGAEVAAVAGATGTADWLHWDIMDGHFVPNISFGAGVVADLRGHTDKPFDVHLMIANPDKYTADFAKAGADSITVHIEACPDIAQTLDTIRQLGVRAGVALKPSTPAEVLTDSILDRVDLILLMTVEPGFGGQAFMIEVLPKIEAVATMIGTRPIDIEVDGGITADTAPQAVAAGATVFVAGSAIFKGGDRASYAERIEALRS